MATIKSIEEKAKAYDDIIERLKDFQFEYRFSPFSDVIGDKFPELKESEDERIRKGLIEACKQSLIVGGFHKDKVIAWLEKQDEHANFINNIQIGDKVTRNEDGVLVNLSQLKRVAKKDEKQGEKNPADTEKGAKGNEREIPNSAWSEEDEYCRHQLIVFCENCMQQDSGAIRCANWLKSLRPQSQWKPSDEQMNALNYVVNLMASSERPTENDLYYNILKSLRQQLMKLKG